MTTRQSSLKKATRVTRRQSSNPQSKAVELRKTTISFTAPNVIADGGNGFTAAAGWLPGQRVKVIGALQNSRYFTIVNRADGLLTVTPQEVADEAAGARITVRQGG